MEMLKTNWPQLLSTATRITLTPTKSNSMLQALPLQRQNLWPLTLDFYIPLSFLIHKTLLWSQTQSILQKSSLHHTFTPSSLSPSYWPIISHLSLTETHQIKFIFGLVQTKPSGDSTSAWIVTPKIQGALFPSFLANNLMHTAVNANVTTYLHSGRCTSVPLTRLEDPFLTWKTTRVILLNQTTKMTERGSNTLATTMFCVLASQDSLLIMPHRQILSSLLPPGNNYMSLWQFHPRDKGSYPILMP